MELIKKISNYPNVPFQCFRIIFHSCDKVNFWSPLQEKGILFLNDFKVHVTDTNCQ